MDALDQMEGGLTKEELDELDKAEEEMAKGKVKDWAEVREELRAKYPSK